MKLKNKILNMVVAVLFAVTTAFCLTACVGGNDREVTNCGMIINGSDKGNNKYIDLGSFTYTGNNPISNYTVYAVYDDGTKTTLEDGEFDYQMTYTDKSGNHSEDFPDGYPIGSYYLKITYDIWEISVNFEIEPIKNQNKFIIESQGALTIDFQTQQPTIDFNSASKQKLADQGITVDNEFYQEHRRYISVNDVANPNALTQDEIAQSSTYDSTVTLPVGQYYLFMTVPAYNNYSATHSNLIRLTINKIQLVVENADNLTVTYDYNRAYGKIGNFTVQDIYNLTQNLQESIRIKDLTVNQDAGGSDVPLVKTFSAADAAKTFNYSNNKNQLTVEFAFSEDFQKDIYLLPEPVKVTLVVEKANLDKPEISSFNGNNIRIELSESTNIFWQVCDFTLTKPDGSTETLNFNNEEYKNFVNYSVETNGTYTLTITLKDKTNYAWKDGSTDDIVKTLDITIAE